MKKMGTGFAFVCAIVLSMTTWVGAKAESGDDEKQLLKSCMAHAKSGCTQWAMGGGSEGIPRGLTKDTKVELAADETYMLTGKIAIVMGKVFLHMDMNDYTWLSYDYRSKNPFYRIDDATSRWKKYEGQVKTVLATARYAIWAMSEDRYRLEIYLEPTADPIMDEIIPKSGKRGGDNSCQ